MTSPENGSDVYVAGKGASAILWKNGVAQANTTLGISYNAVWVVK
jgi:hypothetical protein